MSVDLVALSLRCEAKLGCPPLVRARGKGPYEKGWNTEGRLDPEHWRKKLARWNGNVAIVTGGELVGVDADLYHPGGRTPSTRCTTSGSRSAPSPT